MDRLKPAMLGAAVALAALVAPLAQSQSGQDEPVISIPMLFEMELRAENVPAPLGPDLSIVMSSITIRARGSGFEDITRTFGTGLAAPNGEIQTPVTSGEIFNANAFFDIVYLIEFADEDPDDDYADQFRTGPETIRLLLPAVQQSRIERSGTCVADTSLPNFGCVPQLVDPKDPLLIWNRDNTIPLGSGVALTIANSSLSAIFVEQIPVPGNQIFTDGFESGDVSAWSVDSGTSSSFPAEPKTTNSFQVTTTGSFEIQEKVVEAGSALVNYFSLVGEGSTSNLGFQTTMFFTNTGGPSDLQIEFFTPAGDPLAVTLAGPPSTASRSSPMTIFNTTLAPGQALSLQTVGLEALQVGYARFTAGPSVGATAVFTGSETSTGATLYDAGVPAISRTLRRFSVFLDSLGVRDTGLAMVRAGSGGNGAAPRGAANNVRLRLFNTDFQQLATTTFFLPEGAQISQFIHEYFQAQPEAAAQAREMQGVVVVESADLLAAITLRLTNDPENPTLTAFPIIEGRAESSMAEAFERGRGLERDRRH